MQIRTYMPDEDELPRGVGELLRREFCVSSRMYQKLKQCPGRILLNGAFARMDQIVKPGDVLSADLSDEEAGKRTAPSPIPAEILYRDAWLVFAQKPAGLIVHETTFHPTEDNMEKRIAAALPEESVFHAVNRLDRYTSGVMCVALCGYMHNLLKSQLHTPDFQRFYLCLCEGVPSRSEGEICLPIGREPGSVIKRCILDRGAESLTRYRVLDTGNKYSLVLCIPLTGRTHQIRLHMRAIGCPLVGDFLYGREIPGVRCMLHSLEARLRHPVSGEKLRIRGELPEDFRRLMIQDFISPHIPEDLSL